MTGASATMTTTRTVVDESFDDVTTTATQQNGTSECNYSSSAIADNLGLQGWSLTKMYKSTGKLKGGTNSEAGVIKINDLDLEGSTYTISFDAKGWTNNSQMQVRVDGVTVGGTKTLPGNTTCTMQTFTITGTNGTSSSNVEFTSMYSLVTCSEPWGERGAFCALLKTPFSRSQSAV